MVAGMYDRLEPPRTHHAYVILRELGKAMRSVASRVAGDAVLDYGAGPTPYRRLFDGFSRYVTADIPGEPADLSIDPQTGRVDAEDGSFEAVVSTQVLEHVPDPDSYLAEAHRLLQPGGTLILSTHGVYWYHPSPGDFWRWTGPGLRLQIERCGFRVTEQVAVVSAPAAALTMFSQYVAQALPRRLAPGWNYVAQHLVDVVNRLARYIAPTDDDAALFLVVAQRL
jgi:SAM-dependent methyltransferase